MFSHGRLIVEYGRTSYEYFKVASGLRVHDVRPIAPANVCTRALVGDYNQGYVFLRFHLQALRVDQVGLDEIDEYAVIVATVQRVRKALAF